MRKQHFCLIGLLVIFGLYGGFAQKIPDLPSNYRGLSQDDIHPIILERFETNPFEWDEKTPQYTAQITKKVVGLSLRSGVLEDIYYLRNFDFDKRKNFQIETMVRWQKLGMMGMAFGGLDESNVYIFQIEPDNTFSVGYLQDGLETKLIDRRAFRNIHTNTLEYNKLTVRKIANTLHFFINEEWVGESKSFKPFGTAVGWTLGDKASLFCNSLTISELHNDHTPPHVIIENPEKEIDKTRPNRYTLYFSDKNKATIKGRIGDQYGLQEVRINNQTLTINQATGEFRHDFSLMSETYEAILDATDNNNNSITIILNCKYFAPAAPTTVAQPIVPVRPTPPPSPTYANNTMGKGKNCILLIGIDQYDSWSNLYNAKEDCKLIANTLHNQYNYASDNIMFLFDEQATRKNIINTFDSLSKVLKPEDNFIIYYAGHGTFDSTLQVGYWVPSDAERNDKSGYIPNSNVRDYLKGIPTKNTLLIADACFSGSMILRETQAPVANAKSRWALTSGGIEPVEDGIPGANSPFAKAVNTALVDNTSEYLPADALFKAVMKLMPSSSGAERRKRQTPLCNAIKDAGDEGGVFVFRKRR